MRSWFTLLRNSGCGAVILVVASAGASARAEGLTVYAVDTGMVESLAGMRDFEEATPAVRPAVISMSIPIARPRQSAGTSSLRSAMPVPMSVSPTGEVFSNSKAVVPLLVGDLEPTIVRVSRPMAGHSVGARPSLPWLKSSASR